MIAGLIVFACALTLALTLWAVWPRGRLVLPQPATESATPKPEPLERALRSLSRGITESKVEAALTAFEVNLALETWAKASSWDDVLERKAMLKGARRLLSGVLDARRSDDD